MDQTDEIEILPGQPRRLRRQMPLWQELPLLLVVAFCVAVLVRTFLLQVFLIPSGSMEDTLLVGDRVLVNKVVYDVRDPRRGEIVVFRGTAMWSPQLDTGPDPGFFGKLGRTLGDLVGVSQAGEKDFIKRVVGLPGDRVSCCDQGRVTVNGIPLDETNYVVRDSPLETPPNSAECHSRRFGEVVVPPGHLFLMGDHRSNSQDSRCQGTVPIDNIIGRAFAIVWPQSRWTSLSTSAPGDKPHAAGAPEASHPVAINSDRPGGFIISPPILGVLWMIGRSRQPNSVPARRLLP